MICKLTKCKLCVWLITHDACEIQLLFLQNLQTKTRKNMMTYMNIQIIYGCQFMSIRVLLLRSSLIKINRKV